MPLQPVDNTIAARVPQQAGTDLSTTMLRAYQMRQSMEENELNRLKTHSAIRASDQQISASQQAMRASEQSMGIASENQQNVRDDRGMLDRYGEKVRAGDPNAASSLASRPAAHAQALEVESKDMAVKQAHLGASARSLWAYRDNPEELAKRWGPEIDGLAARGVIPPVVAKEMRDKPSVLKLAEIMNRSGQMDAVENERKRKSAEDLAKNFGEFMGGGAPAAGGTAAAVPTIDRFVARTKIVGDDDTQTPVGAADGEAADVAKGPLKFTAKQWADVTTAHPELKLKPEDIDQPQKQLLAERSVRRDNARALVKADILPSDRNLHMAQWLGPQGAQNYLSAMEKDPDQPAINLVEERAVNSNRDLFYSPGGQPVSAKELFERKTSVFGDDADGVAGLASVAATPGGSGIGTSAKLGAMARMAMHPDVDKEQKAVVMEFLKSALDAQKPTDLRKNYEDYASDFAVTGKGGTRSGEPELREVWDRKNRREGATNISTGNKEQDKGMVERYFKAQDKALEAGDKALKYQQLGKILSDPNVYTGTLAGPISEAKKVFVSLFGASSIKGVPNAEAAKRMTRELAATFRQPGDQTSTYEAKIYAQMPPGIEDVPGSIQILAAMKVSEMKHAERVAEVWEAHRNKDGSFDTNVFKVERELAKTRIEELDGQMAELMELADKQPQPSPAAGVPAAQAPLKTLLDMYPGTEK